MWSPVPRGGHRTTYEGDIHALKAPRQPLTRPEIDPAPQIGPLPSHHTSSEPDLYEGAVPKLWSAP